MENDSSQPIQTAPVEEEIQQQPRTAPIQTRSLEEKLNFYDKKSKVDERISTQKLARYLVCVLAFALLALYIAGFWIGEGSRFSEAKEHIFPALQAVLFTVLGFVFGEKVSGKKE